MLLVIDEKKKKEILLGDIVNINGSSYIIMKNVFKSNQTYSAMSLNGSSYATGEHNTLEALVGSLTTFGDKFKHYSKHEYQLKLVPKEVF